MRQIVLCFDHDHAFQFINRAKLFSFDMISRVAVALHCSGRHDELWLNKVQANMLEHYWLCIENGSCLEKYGAIS